MKKALLLVDIQLDFLKNGALEVAKGDEVIPVANKLLRSKLFDRHLASRDFHPPWHKSFVTNNIGARVGEVRILNGLSQVIWPNHCVWGTPGSELHPSLHKSLIDKVFKKGMNPDVDSYSAFADNEAIINGQRIRHSTGLEKYLRDQKVSQVYILGLALDFCVRFTALDSAHLGFDTYLVLDGCRAVNLKPNDGDLAVDEMRANGVKVINSGDLL